MKKILFLFSFFTGFFLFACPANASLLVIGNDGELTWKVLADESVGLDIPKHSYIEIEKVADQSSSNNSNVSLMKQDGRVSLTVNTEGEVRELDVSGWQGELVELEERAEVEKISLGLSGDRFIMRQRGVKAVTDFPINVDAEDAEFSVKTPSGNKYLSVFPKDAVDVLYRTKLLSRLTNNNEIEIVEQNNDLQYRVQGEKVLDLVDLFIYSIPVESYVSASTGEIIEINAPTWYKVVAFFLTEFT